MKRDMELVRQVLLQVEERVRRLASSRSRLTATPVRRLPIMCACLQKPASWKL